MGKYKYTAQAFCDAVRKLGTNPEALDNLCSYLENHFGEWLDKYANTPDDLAEEMQNFANITFAD